MRLCNKSDNGIRLVGRRHLQLLEKQEIMNQLEIYEKLPKLKPQAALHSLAYKWTRDLWARNTYYEHSKLL